jgi:hypothetical protein
MASVWASCAGTPIPTSSCCKNPSPRLSLRLVARPSRYGAARHPHPEGSLGKVCEAEVAAGGRKQSFQVAHCSHNYWRRMFPECFALNSGVDDGLLGDDGCRPAIARVSELRQRNAGAASVPSADAIKAAPKGPARQKGMGHGGKTRLYAIARVFTVNSARSRNFRMEVCTASATAGSPASWAFVTTWPPAS